MLVRIKRSLSRPDIQKAPLNALLKRLWWKIRWLLSHRDWQFTLPSGMTLTTPRTGASALTYYLGSSQPEIERAIAWLLKPGHVMFDVGAHVGEFTLSASYYVGSQGAVYAFEPHPVLAGVIRKNIRLNNLSNAHVIETCISDADGSVKLQLGADLAVASMTPAAANNRLPDGQVLTVPAQRLDTFWDQLGRPEVALIKIDVEGAELLALRGAEEILSLPAGQAPAVLFECSRHYQCYGYDAGDVLTWLADHGYQVFQPAQAGGWQPFSLNDSTNVKTQNLLARKAL
jgi:FkbM family methyltransferase